MKKFEFCTQEADVAARGDVRADAQVAGARARRAELERGADGEHPRGELPQAGGGGADAARQDAGGEEACARWPKYRALRPVWMGGWADGRFGEWAEWRMGARLGP